MLKTGQAIRLSAPANLLLMGEYAVTEPGGRGLWLTVDRRATATIQPAGSDYSVIAGRWPQGGFRLDLPAKTKAVGGDPTALANHCWQTVHSWLGRPNPNPTFHLEIDTSPFFDSAGRKLGYGSSATASLLTVAALLDWFSRQPTVKMPKDWTTQIPYLAIAAQRQFQNGRGSGYDAAASFWGGYGCFVGGDRPQFWRLPGQPALDWVAVQGQRPVQTGSAIAAFQTWKTAHPNDWDNFLITSNQLVDSFANLNSQQSAAALAVWKRARQLGIWIGQAIGVPAHLADPSAKAVGAGNELGLKPVAANHRRRLIMANDGLRVES